MTEQTETPERTEEADTLEDLASGLQAEESDQDDRDDDIEDETQPVLADPTDLGSQAAWAEDNAAKFIRSDRAARYAEINAKLSHPSPLSVHPRAMSLPEIIDREEAKRLLQVSSADFTRLVRRAVVRKAHPDLRAQFLYRDVAALAVLHPKSEARKEMEKRLRLQNTLAYMSDFAPHAYYQMDGKPADLEDMDYVDRVANEEYQIGLADLSVKFKSLIRPVAYTDDRDPRDEHDVQFLYLHDEPVPRMTTALEMRRWYLETHPSTRYHVRRIALPPLAMLNRPEHEGVLRFLVQSASILYGMDFEVMPTKYYEMITDQQLKIGGTDELNLYQALTGARISDEAELMNLLVAQSPTTLLPLQLTVAAWYQAYHTLTHSDEAAPLFDIRRIGYLNDLLHQVEAYDRRGGTEPGVLDGLRHKVRTLIGCHDDWASKFRKDAPPAYIGQPPSYEPPNQKDLPPDPLRLRLHPKLRNGHLSSNVVFMMGQNSMDDMDVAGLQAAVRVVKALDLFHAKVVEMVEPSSTMRADRLLVARLFTLLHRHGIQPRSLYLYPIRDAGELEKKIFPGKKANLLLDTVLPELIGMSNPDNKILDRDRPPPERVVEMPNPYNDPDLVGSPALIDITDAVRLEFAPLYALEELGFKPSDIAGLSAMDILEGIGMAAREGLDSFIVKAMGSESRAMSNLIDLEKE